MRGDPERQEFEGWDGSERKEEGMREDKKLTRKAQGKKHRRIAKVEDRGTGEDRKS